jgi:hypothetical protein
MAQRWAEQDLINLMTLDVDELIKLYPSQTKKNIIRRKQEYAKKLREVNLERHHGGTEHNDSPDDKLSALSREFGKAGIELSASELKKATRAGFHVGYIRNADGEIEYTKPLPHVEYAPERSESLLDAWKPATPAKIVPSKRKPLVRDYKTLLVFGDMQIDYRRIDNDLIPIHDEAAMQALALFASDIRPDEMINLGDTVDFAALSRFQKDSDHFYRTLGPSFQRIHDFYAQLRSDNPNAKIVEVDSNHHKRLTDFVLKNMPDFYGVKQAGSNDDYPVFTYPYLANLKHVGVDWVGGYGAAEYQYKDDLAFIHGNFAVSNGSTAAKLAKANPDRNIVQGHVHRAETQYQTDRRGRMLGAFTVGALCRSDGVVPSYHSSVNERGRPVTYQENWQSSAMVIQDYGDGKYNFEHVMIRDGKIIYHGKEYDAAQSKQS